MTIGTVKFFNASKGFGFIAQDSGQDMPSTVRTTSDAPGSASIRVAEALERFAGGCTG